MLMVPEALRELFPQTSHGHFSPTVIRIAQQFHALRDLCASEGLPDKAYAESGGRFVLDVLEDHKEFIDAMNDTDLVLAFKEPAKGLVRGNIQVSRP